MGKYLSWYCMDAAFSRDPKIDALPDNDHRMALVCLFGLEKQGELEGQDVSLFWKQCHAKSLKSFVSILKTLSNIGLIDKDNRPKDFSGWQRRALSQERTRRSRSRNASVRKCNAPVTQPYDCVTTHTHTHTERREEEDSSDTLKNVPKPASKTFIEMPVNDGDEPITEVDIDGWKELYGRIDVEQTIRKMVGHWSSVAKNRRKTRRGIRKSINSWLARDNDKAPVGRGGTTMAKTQPTRF